MPLFLLGVHIAQGTVLEEGMLDSVVSLRAVAIAHASNCMVPPPIHDAATFVAELIPLLHFYTESPLKSYFK